MTDSPPASEAEPEPMDFGAPVVCKKCAGDPSALRHAKGCPNITDEARARRQRKTRPAGAAGPRGASRVAGLEQYAASVGSMLQLAGAARGSMALAYDGEVIIRGAHTWAQSLDALAAENESVARVLDSMLASSAWGGVMISTAGIVVPILACHRILPPATATIFGMPHPPAPPAPPEPEWSEDAGTDVPPTGNGLWPPGASEGSVASGNGQGTGAGAGNPVPPLA